MVAENSFHERTSPQVTPQQQSQFYLNQPLQEKMQTLKTHIQQNYTISFHLPQCHRDLNKPNAGRKQNSQQLSSQVFGFESITFITLRATSLCTKQEFLLSGMEVHRGQVQTGLMALLPAGWAEFGAGRQSQAARAALQLGLPGHRDTHRVCGTAAQWGRTRMKGPGKVSGCLRLLIIPSQLLLPVPCSRSSRSPPAPSRKCCPREGAGSTPLHSWNQTQEFLFCCPVTPD